MINNDRIKEIALLAFGGEEYAKLKRTVEEERDTYEKGKVYLMKKAKEVSDAIEKLITLESSTSSFTEKAENEIKLIQDFPGITDIDIVFEDGAAHLILTTAEMQCYVSNGAIIIIPKNKIRLNLTTAAITIKRLDGNRDKLAHPHVGGDGKPCLGNIDCSLMDYTRTSQLFLATMLIIEWLSSANHDDGWGRRYVQFPIVQKEDGTAGNAAPLEVAIETVSAIEGKKLILKEKAKKAATSTPVPTTVNNDEVEPDEYDDDEYDEDGEEE